MAAILCQPDSDPKTLLFLQPPPPYLIEAGAFFVIDLIDITCQLFFQRLLPFTSLGGAVGIVLRSKDPSQGTR